MVWGGFPEPWVYRSREKFWLETVFYQDLWKEKDKRCRTVQGCV